MAGSDLATARDGGVLEIAFNRPQKKNALTAGMYLAATQALRDAEKDEGVRVVLFRGEGDPLNGRLETIGLDRNLIVAGKEGDTRVAERRDRVEHGEPHRRLVTEARIIRDGNDAIVRVGPELLGGIAL